MTTHKRKVEVFTAGCGLCDETVALVKRLACGSCDVSVHEMHEGAVASKAKQYGVHSVPAVVIDGKIADCCSDAGRQEHTLRSAGLGVTL
ncbi:MAG TPA: thioredoxin family protein [Acidobacteriaceae bacterium]|nr:thioredoxin family protein [Acidobacteriaceae bacterium]